MTGPRILVIQRYVIGTDGSWRWWPSSLAGRCAQGTKRTQWQNPFGVTDDGGVGTDLLDSWGLYERFGFRGLFDDLFGIANRRRLPRTGG